MKFLEKIEYINIFLFRNHNYIQNDLDIYSVQKL
jgi:hypothetical protein